VGCQRDSGAKPVPKNFRKKTICQAKSTPIDQTVDFHVWSAVKRRKDTVTTNKQSASGLLRSRGVVSCFLLVAAFIALVRATAAPHSATQRVVYVRGSADAFGPTPTPPTRHGVLVTPLAQNFDSLIPPALPPGWLATNTLGPAAILGHV